MTTSAKQLDGFEFLSEVDDELLRAQAQNILDSYAHPWDILAEGTQNSVDAIDQHAAQKSNCVKHIAIVFDCKLRSIEICDTGIGMSLEDLRQVLAPGKSLKRGKANLKGEKGVGLSFMVFASNKFRIETCDGKQTTSVEIHNANKWIVGQEKEQPKFRNVRTQGPSEYRGSKNYTRVFVGDIPSKAEADEDVFNYTKERLVHVLRSKTAIGNTYALFNDGKRPTVDVRVELEYTNDGGVRSTAETVDYCYASPADYLKPADVIKWSTYQELRAQAKERTLKGKCLVRNGEGVSDSAKKFRWFALATSRRTYDRISEERNLRTETTNDVEPGIYVSTRGMPTGIQLAPPRSQQAAYWPSFFILIEYDAIRWDLGRKFVGGRIAEMLKKVALRDIFNTTVDHIAQFIEGGASEVAGLESEKQLEQIKEDIRKTPDLNCASIQYGKEPREEQGVLAMFHELVAAGPLKNYSVRRSSARETYDAFVHYTVSKADLPKKAADRIGKETAEYDFFMEFKFEASGLLADLENRKRARDIKLLVCWQINKAAFEDQNIAVEQIDQDESIFVGATHQLVFSNRFMWGGENKLHVICLKDLLLRLKAVGSTKK
jgi:hypothetical protein